VGSDPATGLIYQPKVGIKGVVWPQRKPSQWFDELTMNGFIQSLSFDSLRSLRTGASFKALRRFKVQGSRVQGELLGAPCCQVGPGQLLRFLTVKRAF
jgi:hypothetical protein